MYSYYELCSTSCASTVQVLKRLKLHIGRKPATSNYFKLRPTVLHVALPSHRARHPEALTHNILHDSFSRIAAQSGEKNLKARLRASGNGLCTVVAANNKRLPCADSAYVKPAHRRQKVRLFNLALLSISF